ncbi:hypothetical protein LSCM4_06269 [Leishmania orientalis]|uniref:Uncharacterized protein n=1 Tax=Leishmania orientalis TaxID=2249476 RepID=A0A836H8J4_9TRYP|nr:hypothetical protein LSCM4_06269 [Leishmania orientalis]
MAAASPLRPGWATTPSVQWYAAAFFSLTVSSPLKGVPAAVHSSEGDGSPLPVAADEGAPDTLKPRAG